jgi:hypothetical protein
MEKVEEFTIITFLVTPFFLKSGQTDWSMDIRSTVDCRLQIDYDQNILWS